MKYEPLVMVFLVLGTGIFLSLVFSPFLFSTLLADFEDKEVKVQTDCGELFLSWESVERAELYSLYRDDELIYKGELRSFTDRPLDKNVSHRYYLLAENEGGISDFSEQVVITVKRPCPPEIPGDFTVNDSECGGEISFNWEPSARAESYELVRQSVPGSTGRILEWLRPSPVYEGTGTYFEEKDLQPGGIYNYKVRAINESGVSEWRNKHIKSSVVCPPEKPQPPIGE
jgi:hypothetical protein